MIHLEKLTYENFDDVLELKVKEAQLELDLIGETECRST